MKSSRSMGISGALADVSTLWVSYRDDREPKLSEAGRGC